MKTHKHLTRFSVGILPAFCAVLLLTLAPSMAASLTWDPNHTITNPTPLSGQWNTSDTNWSDGSTNVAWSSSPNTNTAVFTGGSTANTIKVTNASTINVGDIVVGYGGSGTLELRGSPLQFGAAGAIINNTGGSFTTVVYAQIQSTNGLTKNGGGGLRLAANNTYTGDTTINNGILYNNVDNALPTNTTLVINSGGFALLGKHATIGSLASTNSSTVVYTRPGTATNVFLTIAGSSTNTFKGQLTNWSGSVLSLTIDGAGTKQTLAGQNVYEGATTITAGALKLDSSLSNSASVTINGGTLSSGTNTVLLGVGDVSMSSGNINPGEAGSIGAFTLANGKNFVTTGGTLNFDLNATNSFDQILGFGSGFFSLSNTTLALSGLTSATNTYQIFSGFGGINVITNLTITGLDSGYSGSLGTDGVLTVVPEPSTWALLALSSLVAVATMRRRRKG